MSLRLLLGDNQNKGMSCLNDDWPGPPVAVAGLNVRLRGTADHRQPDPVRPVWVLDGYWLPISKTVGCARDASSDLS